VPAFFNPVRDDHVILDGYIRLTYKAFLDLRFEKREAWEDENLRMELAGEGTWARRAGYCEWIATREQPPPYEPRLASLGWTWIQGHENRATLLADGLSSNIMLISDGAYDLGLVETQKLLSRWLSEHPWQTELTARIQGASPLPGDMLHS
jgi:hypothetical protein